MGVALEELMERFPSCGAAPDRAAEYRPFGGRLEGVSMTGPLRFPQEDPGFRAGPAAPPGDCRF